MKWLKYFILILIVGYGSIWAPYYVSLFGDVKVIGKIDSDTRACLADKIGNSECKAEYRIDKNHLKNVSPSYSLGLGVIIHSVEVGCYFESEFLPKVTFGDPKNAGKTIDSLNNYLTLPISKLNCSSDVFIRVWSPQQYRRFGLIDGMLVIGEASYVDRVRALTEIFRNSFMVAVTTLFMILLLFNSILSKISNHNQEPNPVEKFQWAWAGYVLIFSGVFNTFIPIVSLTFEVTRLSNFFSLIGRFGPAVCLLSSFRGSIWAKGGRLLDHKLLGNSISVLLIIVVSLQASPYFAKALAPAYLFGSMFCLIASIHKKNSFLFFWAICGLLDGSKVMMIPNLPSSFCMMCMALCAVMDSFILKVRAGTRILDSLHWSRKFVIETNKSFDITKSLREFADRFEIRQISILVPHQDGSCDIHIEKFENGAWQTKKFIREKIPEIYSHVLTTREPLWNIEQKSQYAENMRKGEVGKFSYNGDHFTVLPLVYNSFPVGGVAFTNFPESIVSDRTMQVELLSVTEIMIPVWSKQISSYMIVEKSDWANRCGVAVKEIHDFQKRDNIPESEFYENISQIVARNLDCGSFIGYLDKATRKLHLSGFSGMSDEIKILYNQSDFYAVSQNEQGPIPLSVNRKKPAIVNDVSWVKPVLHPNTVKVFDTSGLQSCASIPIFEKVNDDTENVWGILWLESSIAAKFTQVSERGLMEISSAISSSLRQREAKFLQKRTQEALSGFVPPAVLAKLVKGESVRVAENGFLLMADLRDSTKLSRTIGADAWVSFVSGILPEAEAIAGKYKFEIQAAIWDAIYFTRKNSHPLREEEFLEFSQSLSNLFEIKMCRYFKQEISKVPYASKARFCLVYGDISRDVRHSVTSNWTIVGSSMAAISKMEQACKAFTGWIFVGDSVNFVSDASSDRWESIAASAKGTGEGIFRLHDLFLYNGNESVRSEAPALEEDVKKIAS